MRCSLYLKNKYIKEHSKFKNITIKTTTVNYSPILSKNKDPFSPASLTILAARIRKATGIMIVFLILASLMSSWSPIPAISTRDREGCNQNRSSCKNIGGRYVWSRWASSCTLKYLCHNVTCVF